MKFKFYLFLPQHENDFIRIGDQPDSYTSLVSELLRIKEISKESEAEIWYDENNFGEFAKKANQIVAGSYLANISNQLKRILGNTTKSINSLKISDGSCTYIKWNSDFTYDQLAPLLTEAAEAALSNETLTVVINISEAISCERDTLNVIKDGANKNDLPHLVRIPVLDNDYELKEWIASNYSENRFSLKNKNRFLPTNRKREKQKIYKENATGNYWYYDFFHKGNKEHFEVFDTTGNHLGEADINGYLNTSKKDDAKKIGRYL